MEPLITADASLRGLPSFMLNVDRLLNSDLVALGTCEEIGAALLLWARAWKQAPPGSLPNDERILSGYAKAGKKWSKIREMALRGFVLCDDNRLYHPVLCEDAKRAIKALDSKSKAGTAGGRAKWGDDTTASETNRQNRSQRLSAARERGTHTAEEWFALVSVFEGSCVRCGTSGQVVKDHIIPIYKGGSDAIDNLQPLCASCNSSKGPETIDHRFSAFQEWRERLAERLADGRHNA